jgi:5-methyltetrahydropteroyltriglutamate--homocysteine methyltransferase
MKFLKTVVGSFPQKKIALEEAIKLVVDLQLKHGIDIISDGEQRADIIGYFGSLPGLGMKPNGPYIKSKVTPLEEAEDFVKLRDLDFVRDYLRNKGREDVKVKVSVTGPITLGFSCALNGLEYYNNIGDRQLYSDCARALNPLIVESAEKGCYIQIDEPSLSIGIMNPKDAVEIVNEAISGLPTAIYEGKKLIVHICGAFNEKLFKAFMSLDAPILSLAFSALNVRKNMEVVSKPLLQSGEKKLGMGCISVQANKKEEVEKLYTVIERLKTMVDKIGQDGIALIHPDCGLRNTAEDAIEPILETLSSCASFFEQAP